jgi:hypothetical protein
VAKALAGVRAARRREAEPAAEVAAGALRAPPGTQRWQHRLVLLPPSLRALSRLHRRPPQRSFPAAKMAAAAGDAAVALVAPPLPPPLDTLPLALLLLLLLQLLVLLLPPSLPCPRSCTLSHPQSSTLPLRTASPPP